MKSEVSISLPRDKPEPESERNAMELEAEEVKSRSPGRTDPRSAEALRLRSKGLLHSLEEMVLKPPSKPFYFFEPILVSFSDYSLLGMENCLLCGAFADGRDLLTCCACSESFHPYCLYSKNFNRARFFQVKSEALQWLCPNCRLCEKCRRPPENVNNLFCHACEGFYHLGCAYRNVNITPGLTWKCENCFE